MAVEFGYFNSKNGDRKYNADDMSKYFTGLIGRGVLQNYADKYEVLEYEGMSIIVSPGKAYFSDGKYIENTTDYVMAIEPADVILNRIDRIVLQNNKNEEVRAASIVYKKGEPATQPTEPPLINTDDIEELSLALIKVDKLTENITQAEITNTIPDSEVCGYVTGLIDQIDTSDLYNQYQSAYAQNLSYLISSNQEVFDNWFSGLEGITGIILLTENRQMIKTAEETDTLTIEISDFNNSMDITSIYINGLQLLPWEYEIVNNNTLKLAQALPKGQLVDIIVLKSAYGTSE